MNSTSATGSQTPSGKESSDSTSTIKTFSDSVQAVAALFTLWQLVKEARLSRGLPINLTDPKFNLTEKARRGLLSPVVGRDKEVNELINTLLLRDKPNALLIGDPGVGKTAIVEGLAQTIVSGKVPRRLKGCTIIQLRASDFIEGTSYRGQFEAKVLKTIEAIQKMGHVIIFVDETHAMMSVGSNPEGGGNNLSNMLKPYLASGQFRMIGCTTSEEAGAIRSDSAMQRRFTEIKIEKPNKESIATIVQSRLAIFGRLHECIYDPKAVDVILDSSDQLPGNSPDKELHLLDLLGAQAEAKIYPSQGSEKISRGFSTAEKIHGSISIALFGMFLFQYSRAMLKWLKPIQLGSDPQANKNILEETIAENAKAKTSLLKHAFLFCAGHIANGYLLIKSIKAGTTEKTEIRHCTIITGEMAKTLVRKTIQGKEESHRSSHMYL